MQITPIGDSALIVHIRDQFEDAPDETLNQVLSVASCLERTNIPGIIELAPAYTTVAVFFDPLAVAQAGRGPDRIYNWLADRIRAAIAAGTDDGRRAKTKGSHSRLVEIPVCYDPEFALDLDAVARHAQISPRQVVDLHSGAEYRVSCIGFVPGFPFLAGLPKKLATPRRATPRKEIPVGSVGIGGAQTGIYPLRSPGGWNLIGRTPVRLFEPSRNPPTLLRASDRVRFRVITRRKFDSLKC
jgi:inhibitor of KinA